MAIVSDVGLGADRLCLEISERYELKSVTNAKAILGRYQDQGFRIALDDYGAGFSGLQLLYHTEPDYIKIDRFFIQDIDADARKRLFIANIVNTAHALGIEVIAEGVETQSEYVTCGEIGCDMVQGFWIARPTQDSSQLYREYSLEGDRADFASR
jgi:EAL domain-containing protein (putative c-di-GMP-specific phosphodiesterase class I)